MSPAQDESPRTRDAIKKCAEWLAECLKMGWRHDDLDALESLWWEHHDHTGALIVRKP